MNYELAKKLKDAGFPQKPTIGLGGNDGVTLAGFYYYEPRKEMQETALHFINDKECDTSGLVKVPTLSELIKECKELLKGNWYRRIILEGSLVQDYGWMAVAHIQDFATDEAKVGFVHAFGEDLDIAVTKLWLKLNDDSFRGAVAE